MKKGGQQILNDILKRISPSPEEEKVMQATFKTIASKIKIPGAKPMLGGSGAKGTWLKDDYDMDIYVAFSYARYKNKSDDLADILEKALKKKFKKVMRLHGSRDYFHILTDNYTVEIVPILAITNAKQALNITDCSQLHVKYVQKHKKLAFDMRLAKAFAKGADVYGAESYIRGFSGYVLELLTIHYGSFTNLIRAVARWNSSVIIGDKRKAANLNYAKKQSPLILIDPVQPDRNAAAALSEEKYYDFIIAARAFLRQPVHDFFIHKHVNLSHLEHHGDVIALLVKPRHTKQDIAGAKLMKALEFLTENIKEHDFTLLQSGWLCHNPTHPVIFYFLVAREELSEKIKLRGPPITNAKAVTAFSQAHDHVLTEGDRLYAFDIRPYRTIDKLFPVLIKRQELKDKARDISIIHLPLRRKP